MDIVELILSEHHEQRRLFLEIAAIPRDDEAALKAVWSRLRGLLDRHAEAEERFFYPELLKIGRGAADASSAKDETKDAIEDHNKIRDKGKEVDGHDVGSNDWLEAIAQVNIANSDHMAEEERQGLSDFRRHAGASLRERLAREFERFSAEHLTGLPPVDKNADEYVEEHS